MESLITGFVKFLALSPNFYFWNGDCTLVFGLNFEVLQKFLHLLRSRS